MKTVEFWEITSRDGSPLPICKFLASLDLALLYISNNPSHSYIRRSITICDSLEEWKQLEEAELRAGALAKLTPAERKVLGLED